MNLRTVTEADIWRKLREEGWRPGRSKGSHLQWHNPAHPHRRVTTTVRMSPNVKRSVFRQAGWDWLEDATDRIKADILKEAQRVASENEALRQELYQLIEICDQATRPSDDRPRT